LYNDWKEPFFYGATRIELEWIDDKYTIWKKSLRSKDSNYAMIKSISNDVYH